MTTKRMNCSTNNTAATGGQNIQCINNGAACVEAQAMNMRIEGLSFYQKVEVPALKAVDLVVSYQTYALGDGHLHFQHLF